MKSIYDLAALALTFALAQAAPAYNDQILVQFCKSKTSFTPSTCTRPVSIYELGSFDIPKGYIYAHSVPTPLEYYYTLSKNVGGKTIACSVLLTNVKWDDVDSNVQYSSGATYVVNPGKLKAVCTNGKCVECSDFNI